MGFSSRAEDSETLSFVSNFLQPFTLLLTSTDASANSTYRARVFTPWRLFWDPHKTWECMDSGDSMTAPLR